MAILQVRAEENQLLRAAYDYAQRGWLVMPLHGIAEGNCTCGKKDCDSPGKHPRTPHGFKDATLDETTIESWWATWSRANLGVATGPESGFFMIGPDGQAGIDALAELERQHGPLPRTPMLRSGGGGRHYYFAWPPEGGIKTLADVNGLPIDVRGAGGLVVAPPSVHLSGNSYAWEIRPEEADLAAAPGWLLEILRNGKGTRKPRTNRSSDAGKSLLTVHADRRLDVQARAIAYLEKCPPAISHQGGHNQTFDVARAIVYGFDLGAEVGFKLLWEHYNPRCVPPWSDAELRHKCLDADTKPFDRARGYLVNEGERSTSTNVLLPVGGAGGDIEALPMPSPAPWPVLAPEAFQGLAGEIVRSIEPQTEADPVAILGQFLVAFGNAVGRKPSYRVEGDRHYPNLFLITVGKTAHGRKGTSWGRVRQVMEPAAPDWISDCVLSGLASGEGLVYFVRDPVEKMDDEGEIKVVDEGVEDKRLLVMESEFAQVLRVLKREGNTLSVFIRQSWDMGTLATLTRHSPLRATDAHISIIGHVTLPELGKYLDQAEMLNGFANRFLWLLARRSKLLPDGGYDVDLSRFGPRLAYALAASRNVDEMTRSQAARKLWHEVYPELTAERSGLYGAVTGRAEAQVLRLSMMYALLAGGGTIEEDHLRAALAFWSYADASAKLIFGAEPEDPLIGLVMAKLRESPSGMTRTDLHNAFSHNIPAAKLLEALAKLRDCGDAYAEKTKTGRPGAPAERWFARKNELNELIDPSATTPEDARIDSFNSFLRSSSLADAGDGERKNEGDEKDERDLEVVTL
jgi:hypothetical protein